MKTAGMAGAALAVMIAGVLVSRPSHAMEIRQFDKMASEDKGEYVSLLVGGAERVLKDEGRTDLTSKVEDLFTKILPGDQVSVGMVEFTRNVARARVADAERILKDPSAHRIEVEDAMLVTLKKNNIPLSEDFIGSFRAINAGFRPKLPLQK